MFIGSTVIINENNVMRVRDWHMQPPAHECVAVAYLCLTRLNTSRGPSQQQLLKVKITSSPPLKLRLAKNRWQKDKITVREKWFCYGNKIGDNK